MVLLISNIPGKLQIVFLAGLLEGVSLSIALQVAQPVLQGQEPGLMDDQEQGEPWQLGEHHKVHVEELPLVGVLDSLDPTVRESDSVATRGCKTISGLTLLEACSNVVITATIPFFFQIVFSNVFLSSVRSSFSDLSSFRSSFSDLSSFRSVVTSL